MKPIIVFGDSQNFAIRCAKNTLALPRELDNYCHWLLGNKLIGDPQEPCYLPIWLAALGHFKQSQLPQILSFEPAVTTDITAAIFTTLQQDSDTEVTWREELENVWSKHRLGLDETQDAWLLMAHREGSGLRFTWMGWREPCPAEDIGRIFSCWASTSLVVESIDECFRYYKVDL
jgi:hypothetical protein